ncbi:hypothetical protein D9756_010347 [Leucocoprinus leucothites]|uniref:Uncharacterized protein n=1 Tax=Leucocoprinus leucothites TaxID=201217 RepID=A0A8H5CTC9_9AGAR|nr:hypothetical protein D9756_010347 [Leucoagaricus leucothites]
MTLISSSAGAGSVLTSARDLAMRVSMLLNEGKHLYTGEQAIPSHVVEHAATSVTVTEGKASYPELCQNLRCRPMEILLLRPRTHRTGRKQSGLPNSSNAIPERHDNLATVSLSNDANSGWLMESSKWRIIGDVLFSGQEPTDWDGRYEETWANYTRSAQLLTPRSSPKPPSSSNPTLFSPPSPFPPPLVDSANSTNVQNARPYSTLPVRRILREMNLAIPTFTVPRRSVVTLPQTELVQCYPYLIKCRIRPKDGLAMPPRSSPIVDSRIAIQSRNKGQTPLHTDRGDDEDDGDMLMGLDEHFEVEWVIGEEEGLAFEGGSWGMEGPDAKARDGVLKESAEVWFVRTIIVVS